MPTNDSALYLDSSALVKLVVAERETTALRSFLQQHPRRVSCSLATVEVVRAVRPQGAPAVARSRQVLGGLDLLQMDQALLEDAGLIDPPTIRTMDAIHLAAARRLGSALTHFVTYDNRLRDAAVTTGLPTVAPS